MLDACRRHRVQFMDGVMFMHSRRLPLLRQVLDDGQSIGTVRRIASQFSFLAPEEFYQQNIRASSDLEPLGCLGDLGWYNVRFSLWVMNQQLPERVTGRILAQHVRGGRGPVPIEFSGELLYPGGVSASFYCSFRAENQQWAIVSGTQGYLTVPDFVLPFFGSEAGFEVNCPRVSRCGAATSTWRATPAASRQRVQQRHAGFAGDEHDPDVRPDRHVRAARTAVGRDGPEDAAGSRRLFAVGSGGRKGRAARRVTTGRFASLTRRWRR